MSKHNAELRRLASLEKIKKLMSELKTVANNTPEERETKMNSKNQNTKQALGKLIQLDTSKPVSTLSNIVSKKPAWRLLASQQVIQMPRNYVYIVVGPSGNTEYYTEAGIIQLKKEMISQDELDEIKISRSRSMPDKRCNHYMDGGWCLTVVPGILIKQTA